MRNKGLTLKIIVLYLQKHNKIIFPRNYLLLLSELLSVYCNGCCCFNDNKKGIHARHLLTPFICFNGKFYLDWFLRYVLFLKKKHQKY